MLRGIFISDIEEQFMMRALQLARKGRRYVSPNPMVGAVVVKDNRIIGEGYHEKFGQAHAEINALRDAGDDAHGATLYVTLEPCSHKGKTPPCVNAILDSGVAQVVIGFKDPNPLVNGKGIYFLKAKGIKVTLGVLEEYCRQVNEVYIHYVTTGKPLITLKMAQTLDGRIATSTGHSKWITSEDSRVIAHRLRSRHDAVMVGIGTLLADDPQLSVRHVRGPAPKRIVLDSRLRLPLDAHVLSDEAPYLTIVATTRAASREKISRIEERGASVLVLPEDERGWVNPDYLWNKMAEMGIASVLVEGGSTVHTECLKRKNADRMVLFIAPKILGSGIDAIGDLGIRNINSALGLTDVRMRNSGKDLIIAGKIVYSW
jgi:diaminohydroxyphosphoribosylaminopyrimidine deaminase / 5-amino-6-(5-phosphoribosylamino)uracil reductase